MSSKVVLPHDVHSPKGKWNLIAVLDDGLRDGTTVTCALAVGRWDGKPVLAMRWNGTEENPIGTPQSRGIPTWFIVPQKYNAALLEQGVLTPDKVALARTFLPNA